MQNTAIIKRLIISITFLVIFVAVGFLVYYTVSPSPTCSDQKQNQSEKGIDCGGPCSPCKDIIETKELVVKETAVVTGGNNTYDVVAKISNPNDSIGASSFDYIFTLKDASGMVLATREGKSFILPSDSKFVAELGLQTLGGAVPVVAEMSIDNPQWSQLNDVIKPQLGIYSKKFGKSPMGDGSEAEGILRNESVYDLKKISIVIVLRDEKGQILGVNTTEKNSVRSREERDFRLTWPYALSGSVQSMEVDAESDVFDAQNFSVER